MIFDPDTTTILLVDDDAFIRFSHVDMLEDFVHTIIEASDGEQALQMLEAHPEIDLIISDCQMKKVHGDELFCQLRQNGDMRPFLMISGESGERREQVEHIMREFGNAAFVSKPVGLRQVLESVEALTLNARPMDEPIHGLG